MRSGISRKILLPTLMVIGFGLVAVLLIFYFNARAVVQQELGRRLQREVQTASKLIDSWLKARTNDITIWSRQEVLVEALTEDGYYGRSALQGAQQLLATLRSGYPFFESIFLADSNGEVMVHAVSEMGSTQRIQLADRPYFKETLQGRSVISKIVQSRLTDKRIFVITAPIIKNEIIVGVLGGVVDFSSFKSIFFDDFKIKQYGYAFLSSNRQQILASSKDNEKELSTLETSGLLQRIASQDNGEFIQRLGAAKTLTVFQHLRLVDWSFNINQSLDDTLLPLTQIIKFSTVGALIVMLFISIALAVLFHRLIVARLQHMLQIIGNVRNGDLSQRLHQISVKQDEITELANSFNAMIEHLECTVTDLNREIQVRKETEGALADHQENLEKIIEQRGEELKKEVLERKRAEDRLIRAEKLEMIGTLAGGVAHDLNNILSGIVSYPDLLLMKLPDDSPLYKPLQTIKESGEKASAIVQDLLTLARRGMAVKEPINLNILISEYLESPEFKLMQFHHPNIEVVTEYAEDLFPIMGSPVHLAKTIMNLVTNAAEAMDKGGTISLKTDNRYIDNSLRVYERIEQGEYVVLEMKDQGGGIKAEDVDKIFEPFYTSKKMGKSGTGLGMAIVWGTVKDHNGYINCESSLGVGTTFTLYFPVTSKIVQQHLQTVSISDYLGHGEHILVVDDVEEQREIAASILTELGYRVSTVESGPAALRLAKHERFDLLLLDMILANGMDGLETYRQFIIHAPGQKAIITSGFSETERVTEAIRLGVGGYIKKPYTIAKLSRAIREELSNGKGKENV